MSLAAALESNARLWLGLSALGQRMKVTQPIAFLWRGGLGPPTSKEKNAAKFVPYAPWALRLSWTLKMTSANPTICCRGSQETKKLSDLSEGASLFEVGQD